MTGQRADALVLNPELVVASRDTSRTVYWNPVSGRRVVLPSPVAGVLEQARTCAIAAGEAAGNGAAARSIRLLRDHGLLVPRSEAAAQAPPAAGGQGLFWCRRLSLAAALQDPATDAVVIGMPYRRRRDRQARRQVRAGLPAVRQPQYLLRPRARRNRDA